MFDPSGYKLTFDDEFNTRSVSRSGDLSKWQDAHDQWLMADGKDQVGFDRFWFVYPASGSDPFSVENGTLTITAVPDKASAGVSDSRKSTGALLASDPHAGLVDAHRAAVWLAEAAGLLVDQCGLKLLSPEVGLGPALSLGAIALRIMSGLRGRGRNLAPYAYEA